MANYIIEVTYLGGLVMSRTTRFLKLFLPSDNDYYRVEQDQNENFEKIDKKLEEWDTGKEPKIHKKTGFNLNKTDDYDQQDSNKLATGMALYRLWQAMKVMTGSIELTWEAIRNKPAKFPPENHNHDNRYSRSDHTHDERYAGKAHAHDDRYYTQEHIDGKLAEKSNVVKKVWSGMYTKKGGIVCSLPSGWKVVFIQISWHSTYRGSTTTETLFKDTYQLKGFGVGDEGSSEYTIEIDYYDRVKFTGRGQGDDAAIEAVHVI